MQSFKGMSSAFDQVVLILKKFIVDIGCVACFLSPFTKVATRELAKLTHISSEIDSDQPVLQRIG